MVSKHGRDDMVAFGLLATDPREETRKKSGFPLEAPGRQRLG
jgi:ribosomal protein S9